MTGDIFRNYLPHGNNRAVIIFIRYLFLVFLTIFFSCEEIYNCGECSDKELIDATLKIKLSLEYNYRPITVYIYSGKIEDQIIFAVYEVDPSYLASTGEWTVTLKANREYTVTATYYEADKSYTCVDSVMPKIKMQNSYCEQPCYLAYDNNLNLRLKY